MIDACTIWAAIGAAIAWFVGYAVGRIISAEDCHARGWQSGYEEGWRDGFDGGSQ